jgi:hypothetical protein
MHFAAAKNPGKTETRSSVPVNSSATKILHDPMRSGASAQQRTVRSGRIIHGCRLAGKVDPPRQRLAKMAALIRPRTDRGV